MLGRSRDIIQELIYMKCLPLNNCSFKGFAFVTLIMSLLIVFQGCKRTNTEVFHGDLNEFLDAADDITCGLKIKYDPSDILLRQKIFNGVKSWDKRSLPIAFDSYSVDNVQENYMIIPSFKDCEDFTKFMVSEISEADFDEIKKVKKDDYLESLFGLPPGRKPTVPNKPKP